MVNTGRAYTEDGLDGGGHWIRRLNPETQQIQRFLDRFGKAVCTTTLYHLVAGSKWSTAGNLRVGRVGWVMALLSLQAISGVINEAGVLHSLRFALLIRINRAVLADHTSTVQPSLDRRHREQCMSIANGWCLRIADRAADSQRGGRVEETPHL